MAERPRPRPPSPEQRAKGSARDQERAALEELVEVERAIAALEGRNVANAEHLVVQRGEAEKRRADLERIIAESRAEMARRRKLLPYKIGAVIVALGVVAAVSVPIWRELRVTLDERSRAIESATAAARPFTRRLSIHRTEVGSAPFTVSATPGRCFVAVAASAAQPGARVKVERGGETRESVSVGWCSCKAEDVQVTASGAAPLAALVLQAPADAVGGADVLAALAPRPGAVFTETVDRACAEAAFDAWGTGLGAEPPARDPARLPPEEAKITAQGLGLIAVGPEGAPFVLVPPPAVDLCVLAVRQDGGALSLRRKGGERVASAKRGAVGFCAKDASGWSVWGESPGAVALFAGPRTRVGGLLGLRDIAARAGLASAVWAPSEDLEQDARDTLSASGIPGTLAGLAPNRPAAIAISTDVSSTLTPSDAGKQVACQPSLDVGPIQTLCLEARPRAFAPGGSAPSGIARGPQPLWLALPPAPDLPALERALGIMAFARRMSAAGFELTSLVGATFTPNGVKVNGRNGEKEVVAIVVSSVKPFVHTLSSSEPWTLEDPRPTPLAPSDAKELRATPKLAPGRATREFIVWRR